MIYDNVEIKVKDVRGAVDSAQLAKDMTEIVNLRASNGWKVISVTDLISGRGYSCLNSAAIITFCKE